AGFARGLPDLAGIAGCRVRSSTGARLRDPQRPPATCVYPFTPSRTRSGTQPISRETTKVKTGADHPITTIAIHRDLSVRNTAPQVGSRLVEHVASRNRGVVLALDCLFYPPQRVDQPLHIAHIDSAIPLG